MFIMGLLTGITVSSVFYILILRGVARDLGCLTAWNIQVLRSLSGLIEDLTNTLKELNETIRSMEVDETNG